MSALFAIVLSGCTPPQNPDPAGPAILLVTIESRTVPADLTARGRRFDNAWAHAIPTRPALASLRTGRVPEDHGVLDPTQHALTVPTLATRLGVAGWRTSADVPAMLWSSEESWGFLTPGIASGPGTFTWVHGSASVVPGWLQENPDGHVLVTGIPRSGSVVEGAGRVPLVWIGPSIEPGSVDDRLAGHVDVHATMAQLAGMPGDSAGRSLVDAPSEQVIQLEALPYFTVGGPLTRVTRSQTGVVQSTASPTTITDLANPFTFDVLPTDPIGTPSEIPRAAVAPLLEAHAALQEGMLRRARRLLSELEQRFGRTPTGDLLTSRLLELEGHPDEALERLIERFGDSPSDALALHIGRRALALRRPKRAAPWFDRVLANRPDHPDALAYALRCARFAFDPRSVERIHARMWTVAPERALEAEVRMDLDVGAPVRIEPEALTRPDPDIRLLRARVLWSRGRWLEAVTLADALIRDYPRHVDTRLQRATWALELGDADLAVRLVGPIARWFPGDLRVAAVDALSREALAGERWRLQDLRGAWRGAP